MATPAPTALAAATTCPAYPWPQDRAQRGQKVFMQSDCAACHSMLPYARLPETAAEVVGPKAAEILVVAAAEHASPRLPVHGGDTPDLTSLVAKVQKGLRYNLYSSGGAADVCQELKKKMVWLQFVQPYIRASQPAA